jgi:hypothetical protein
LSAGLYFTFKLLTIFSVAKRIAEFAVGVKAKLTLFAGRPAKESLAKNENVL